jgi:hypothetical protein
LPLQLNHTISPHSTSKPAMRHDPDSVVPMQSCLFHDACARVRMTPLRSLGWPVSVWWNASWCGHKSKGVYIGASALLRFDSSSTAAGFGCSMGACGRRRKDGVVWIECVCRSSRCRQVVTTLQLKKRKFFGPQGLSGMISQQCDINPTHHKYVALSPPLFF